MRRKALIVGLGSASMAVLTLCGCSLDQLFPAEAPMLSNQVAVDRALRLCSLTESEKPFHLILDITPPRGASAEMRAQVEIYWLNPVTYRTDIRSKDFSQIRIVNGDVVEEHDTGDFYPRWIQNFVDALLAPVPQFASLRKAPGTVPVSASTHACISQPGELLGSQKEAFQARICFMGAEPKIASARDFTRYVSFDDYAPFGSQRVAHTLVNVLPANTMVNGRVIVLEPLPEIDYPLIKAKVYTPPLQRIQTTLVSQEQAEPLLISPLGENWIEAGSLPGSQSGESSEGEMTLYIRTDRTGRVREAYRDSSDIYGMDDAAVARALTYRFKPLVVNGVARQMEAPITLPLKPTRRP